MDLVKIILIIAVVGLYWKFVYYKYHGKDFTPISLCVGGGILFIYGFYLFFIKKSVFFQDVAILYFIMLIFAAMSYTLTVIGISKRGLSKNIDITLTWIKKFFPHIPPYFWYVFVDVPAFFFVLVATYGILGQEHIFFWGLILSAWVVSGIRLFKYIYKTK
jgi:hypothetical protein